MAATLGQTMNHSEDSMVHWLEQHSKLSAQRFPIGIGDDMAQIHLGGESSCLITTDMLLEGVHFDLTQATLEQVGYKAMAVSLSDCAAMATVPVAAVVSVALGRGQGERELKALHVGISKAGDRYGCAVVGGDMTAWDQPGGLALNVSMLSTPGQTAPVKRSGACIGDQLCVTGPLGGSLQGKHLDFAPRVQEALYMAKTAKIHAMIDISDGLSTDLHRICRRSAVGALIMAERIPLSRAAQDTPQPLASALNDGEDFELLFALPQTELERLLRDWPFTTHITSIGSITGSNKVQMQTKDGQILDLEAHGYDHLAPKNTG